MQLVFALTRKARHTLAALAAGLLALWAFGASAQTPATGAFLTYNAYGGATPLPLIFNINGQNYEFPFTTGGVVGPATTTVGHCAIWENITGSLLGDSPCGSGGSGFPITLGSTSIAGSSTTTSIAGLTLTSPAVNGGALSGTLSGSPTFSGVPLFSGLSVGTQVSCLGLTSGNALALSSGACGSGGGLPSLTNGQILANATGVTGAAQATNLAAASGITITATGGTITIGASGSGGVSGPGSSVNGDLASWNGTAGNALLDSGILGSNIVQASRTISTTSPLTGGGNLSANLNLGIIIPNASLLGGTGSAFTSIGLGGCLSISGGTLLDSCDGTVTSVGLSLPTAVFSISGSPITGAGTLSGSFVNQAANSVFAGPSTGSPAAPGFRALTNSDLPTTGVSAGSYTTANITVNAQGVVTAAASGSASTPVVFAGGTTAGTANAQTLAAPVPSGYTLTDQYEVRFKVGAGLANTAASPTLAVNSTSAEPMDIQSGGVLVGLPVGFLQPALQYSATYQVACTCYVVTTTPSGSVTQATTSASGTGASPTAAQFAFGQTINLLAASLTSTIPVSTTLSSGSGVVINAINAGTLTATSPDVIVSSAGTSSAGGSVALAAGTVTTVTTDGAGHLYAAGNAGSSHTLLTASKTSNYTVLSGDTGTHFDNTGATGAVIFTLPTPAAGFNACFSATAAQTVEVLAGSGVSIVLGLTNKGAAGNFQSGGQYSSICFYVPTGSTTLYLADASTGTWN